MSMTPDTTIEAEGAVFDRFRDLFEVLSDLIKRVADSEDPAIRSKRAQVREKLIRLESDPTAIAQCLRAAGPSLDWACERPRQAPSATSWGKPAIAALTAATVALTLLTEG